MAIQPFNPAIPIRTPFGTPGGWASGWHTGADFPAPAGTQVLSICAGTVVETGTAWGSAYGSHQVVVEDANKSRVLYAHMQSYGGGITVGATVQEGTVVGTVGNEGRSSGPHLHLEIRKPPYQYKKGTSPGGNNDWIDPAVYLGGAGIGSALPGGVGGSFNASAGNIGGTAGPSAAAPYSASGSFVEVKSAFENFEDQKKKTKWNPPLPKVLQVSSYPATSKGFIIRDPISLTKAMVNGGAPNGPTPTAPDPNTVAPGVPKPPDADRFSLGDLTGDNAFGFRFLMNPATVSEGYSPASVDPIALKRSMISLRRTPDVSTTGSTMYFDIDLSRVDDMRLLRLPNGREMYDPALTEAEAKAILTRGTMADIEYLFRTVNGITQPVWWQEEPSSDWGAFLPRPVVIAIGGEKKVRQIRAVITDVTISHTKFDLGMIPVLTKVSLRAQRLMDSMASGVFWNEDQVANTPVATQIPGRISIGQQALLTGALTGLGSLAGLLNPAFTLPSVVLSNTVGRRLVNRVLNGGQSTTSGGN